MSEPEQGTKPNRAVPKELWIVIGISSLVTLFMVFVGFRMQGIVDNPDDPYHYKQIARHYADHGFDKLTRRGAMLYPHLIWLVYELGGSDFVIQLLHVVFQVGTCVLVFWVAQKLLTTRTAFIAGLCVAFHPMLLRYVGEFHTETMLAFMYMATVACAVRFHLNPTLPNGVFLGVVGMLGTLTKGVILPVLVAYAAVWFFGYFRGARSAPKKLLPVIAIGIAAAVVVAPWTYRNYQVTNGKFVLLTPGTPDAFLRGYVFTRLEFATLQKPPYTDAENESNDLFRRIAIEAGTTWEQDEVVDDENNKRYIIAYIKAHPLETVRKFVVGLFTFWYQMTSLRNSLVPATLAIGSWALAFFGFQRARKEKQPLWLVWLPIVVTNVFVAALIPLGRYSVPILPCLTILAAFGVDTLLDRYRARKEAAASPATH